MLARCSITVGHERQAPVYGWGQLHEEPEEVTRVYELLLDRIGPKNARPLGLRVNLARRAIKDELKAVLNDEARSASSSPGAFAYYGKLHRFLTNKTRALCFRALLNERVSEVEVAAGPGRGSRSSVSVARTSYHARRRPWRRCTVDRRRLYTYPLR